MKKLVSEIVLILAGLGIAVSLFAGLKGQTETDSLVIEAPALEAVAQQETEFEMRDLESRQIFELAEPGEPLWGPIELRLDSAGPPMVIDFGDMTIKLISEQGEHIATLGSGEGQGPGEFLSITDTAFLQDGFWVADSSNSRLSAFDRDGTLRETLKLSTPPYRIASMTPDRILVRHSLSELEAFGIYSPEGNRLGAFGKFIDEPWDGLTMEGMVARSADGTFVHVGKYWGFFSLYDTRGHRLYSRETLQPTPFPELSRKRGVVRVASGTTVSALSASIDADRLFLLRGSRLGKRLGEHVDVYELGSGDYLYSFLLPQPSSHAYFVGESMYLVHGSTLSKWSFEVR